MVSAKHKKASKDVEKLAKLLPKQGMCLDSPTALSLSCTAVMQYFARDLRGDDKNTRHRHIMEKLPGLFLAGAARIAHEDAGTQRPEEFWQEIVDVDQTWASSIPGNLVFQFVLYMMQARREFLVSDDESTTNNQESVYVAAIDAFEDNLKLHHKDNFLLIARYQATSRGQRDDDLLQSSSYEDDTYFDDSEDEVFIVSDGDDEDGAPQPSKKRGREDDDEEEEDEAPKKRFREDSEDEATSEPRGPALPESEQNDLRAEFKEKMSLEGPVTPAGLDIEMEDV